MLDKGQTGTKQCLVLHNALQMQEFYEGEMQRLGREAKRTRDILQGIFLKVSVSDADVDTQLEVVEPVVEGQYSAYVLIRELWCNEVGAE